MNPVHLKLSAEVCAIYDSVSKPAEVNTNSRGTSRACREAVARLHCLWSEHTLETEEVEMLVAALAMLGQAGWCRTGRRRILVVGGLKNLRDLAQSTVARTFGGSGSDWGSMIRFLVKPEKASAPGKESA